MDLVLIRLVEMNFNRKIGPLCKCLPDAWSIPIRFNNKKKKEEMFYLMMHSTHFTDGYMTSDIW